MLIYDEAPYSALGPVELKMLFKYSGYKYRTSFALILKALKKCAALHHGTDMHAS